LKGVTLAKKSRKEEDVEAYRCETETRKNVVTVGLASSDTSKPKPKKYDYDPPLYPQLVWTGKAENTSFEVFNVSFLIHERIAPEAIIRSIRREPVQPDLFAKPDTDMS
jgi:adenine-specific DNA-methyltransferase